MRDIPAITSDLQKSATELAEKTKIHDEASAASTKAFQELDAVKVKINELRVELNVALNALVPESMQTGVRQS